MILNSKPLSLPEVKEILGKTENEAMHTYLKEFCTLKKEDAEKLSSEIRALNNPKIGEMHIVKIVDFLPKDSEEVNKIFNDVSLSEEEANAISEIAKGY